MERKRAFHSFSFSSYTHQFLLWNQKQRCIRFQVHSRTPFDRF